MGCFLLREIPKGCFDNRGSTHDLNKKATQPDLFLTVCLLACPVWSTSQRVPTLCLPGSQLSFELWAGFGISSKSFKFQAWWGGVRRNTSSLGVGRPSFSSLVKRWLRGRTWSTELGICNRTPEPSQATEERVKKMSFGNMLSVHCLRSLQYDSLQCMPTRAAQQTRSVVIRIMARAGKPRQEYPNLIQVTLPPKRQRNITFVRTNNGGVSFGDPLEGLVYQGMSVHQPFVRVFLGQCLAPKQPVNLVGNKEFEAGMTCESPHWAHSSSADDPSQVPLNRL